VGGARAGVTRAQAGGEGGHVHWAATHCEPRARRHSRAGVPAVLAQGAEGEEALGAQRAVVCALQARRAAKGRGPAHGAPVARRACPPQSRAPKPHLRAGCTRAAASALPRSHPRTLHIPTTPSPPCLWGSTFSEKLPFRVLRCEGRQRPSPTGPQQPLGSSLACSVRARGPMPPPRAALAPATRSRPT
jgi:hypothetical protein